jgi:hypothetical protein
VDAASEYRQALPAEKLIEEELQYTKRAIESRKLKSVQTLSLQQLRPIVEEIWREDTWSIRWHRLRHQPGWRLVAKTLLHLGIALRRVLRMPLDESERDPKRLGNSPLEAVSIA